MTVTRNLVSAPAGSSLVLPPISRLQAQVFAGKLAVASMFHLPQPARPQPDACRQTRHGVSGTSVYIATAPRARGFLSRVASKPDSCAVVLVICAVFLDLALVAVDRV